MEAWHLDATPLDLMVDAALLGATLIAATMLRRHSSVLQRYLIPNALIAGCIGLMLGPEVFAVVPIALDRMGAYVYHLLALTFVCVGLRGSSGKRTYAAMHLGFMQVLCMLLQGLLGLAIVLGLYLFVDPGTSPAAGILLPLGFAMGPGVAYSIGASWATFGFPEGASVGLTLAAAGFLAAYVIGVALVHRSGHSSGELPESVRTGFRTRDERTVAGYLTVSPGAVEPLALHVAIVGAIYGGTYLLVTGLAAGLENLGRPQEIPVVWSFHFILANLVALTVRKGLERTGSQGFLDSGLLDRLTGVMADFLIAASIMAISVGIAWRYALPIALMAISGTLLTLLALRITSRWIFREYRFERFIGMFGEMTGTVVSGLALIRILDPEYRSPVAQDLVLSSGVALFLAFPLLASINLPFTMFAGRTSGFFALMAVLAVYLCVILGVWRLFFLRTRSTEFPNR